MLQNSSVGTGHSYENFTKLHGRLDRSMDIIVEQYYSLFNEAVNIFGGIVENVNKSCRIVSNVRKDIFEFREQVQYKRGADLPAMFAAVKDYKSGLAASRKLGHIQLMRKNAKKMWELLHFVPAARSLMDCLYDARFLRQTIHDDSLIGSIYETSRSIDKDRDVSLIQNHCFLSHSFSHISTPY